MGSKSNFLELELLDHVLRNSAYTPPATVYLALYTAVSAPTDAGGGSEVSGFAYARQAIAFAVAASGATSNSGTVTFPVTSGGNWGVVTYWGLFDASTAGNLLYWGTFTTPAAVNDGDQVVIGVGDIDIAED
jgi:hypothetical protein